MLIVFSALLSDAFFAWPSSARIVIDVVALGLAVAACGWLAARLVRERYSPRQVAILCEERLQREDSLLISSVEFQSGLNSGSELLRRSVVRQAESTIHDIPATRVSPLTPVIRALLAAAVACALFAASIFAMPRLFGAVVPRFLDPTGDHPPFTLLRFSATVTPDPAPRDAPP